MSTTPDVTATRSAVKLALLASKARAHNDELQAIESDPIAIVGVACRIPGGADSPAAFWELLMRGGDAISEVPAARWDSARYFDPNPAAPGKTTTRFGGFLNDIESFDPTMFGIAPKEAVYMDPQQRLLLEVAWEAFNDAGYPLERLRRSATGVFFAVGGSDYSRLQLSHPNAISAHTLSGTQGNMAAGRLSYLFDLRGPSVVVDTACSSSLVAIHLAVQSLRRGESSLAIAGGTNVNLLPEISISLAKWGMVAPDGRCKTFDERADGFVRSEGCGAIVMKRLSDALRDRDPIQAVIRASVINQDGRSNVLTAPNGAAQRDLLRSALRQAQVAAADITYVETHGTGTKVGDPIEVEALAEVLGRPRADGSKCFLGAVKANVGHLEAAAGVTGVIKTVLCLRKAKIPPQIHFRKLNPLISLDDTALQISAAAIDWTVAGKSRLAGVSSFGFSGTNAHVILEEAPKLPPAARPARAELLVLSAKSEAALAATIERYSAYLTSDDLPCVADLCYTAAARRHHYKFRSAAVGTSPRELIDRLRTAPTAECGDTPPRVAFVFSGQGSGWGGMGDSLLRDEPLCRALVDRCDDILRRCGVEWSVREALIASDGSWMRDTAKYQVALFTLQAAITELLRAWGVRPGAVLGHSVGELGAAYAAGALTLEQAIQAVERRGRAMQAGAPSGAMAVVGLPLERVESLLAQLGGDLVIAAHNGPESVTVAGSSGAVDRLLVQCELIGRFARKLDVDRAFHSADMDSAARVFADDVSNIVPSAAISTRLFSSVTGGEISTTALTSDYWRRNIRNRVQFAEAAAALLAAGYTSFVEIGPHPGLVAGLSSMGAGRRFTAHASLRRGQDARAALLESVAALYRDGFEVDWQAVNQGDGRCVSSLPAYAWQRERCWFEVGEHRAAAAASGSAPLLGARIESAFSEATVFDSVLSPAANDWLADHRVGGACVMPGAGFIEMALEGAADILGAERGIELHDSTIERALVLPENEPRRVQVGVTSLADGRLAIRIASKPLESAETWTNHFSCTAAAAPRTPVAQLVHVEARRPHDLEAMYRRLSDKGLEFGPKFRRVAALTEAARETRATLRGGGAPTGFLLFPPLLDACLHALEPYFAASDDAWLPVEVGRFVWFRAGEPVEVHTRIRESSGSSSDDLRADLTLYDASGRPLATIDDFRLKRAPLHAIARLNARPAEAFLHEWRWERTDLPAGGRIRPKWLVIADDSPVAAEFARRIRDAGGDCRTVTANLVDRQQCREIVASLDATAPWTVILLRSHLRTIAGLDPLAAQDDILRPALYLVQALAQRESMSLWLVTCGSQRFPTDEGVAAATLWGFGAVLDHEHPDLRCQLIDLDPGDAAAAHAEALFAEAMAETTAFENRIAWSDGVRYVARLRGLRRPTDRPTSWELRAAPSGLLADLALAPAALPVPNAGEVLVEPLAVGLNFRDVLSALGMLDPGTPVLGGECAGRVVSVGAGVDPDMVGRAVMAYAPHCFATPVAIPAQLVAPIPDGMGFVVAASLPVIFLTAKYGLERCAKLRSGERVLIHAAAGGVGLAAIQVARKNGAEVIATAGSAEKHAYLRSVGVEHVFSSRSTDFKNEVLRLTEGKGVDVVLNSLADEFIEASFDVLARGGRFVELGKRGILTREQAVARRPDAGYFAFDLADVAAERPATITSLFDELAQDLQRGVFSPVPWRSFRLDDLQSAFDYMARARHIGKLVITVPSPAETIDKDGTYLIAGASAGLAPPLMRALISSGAQHLLLLSRGAPNESLRSVIADLESAGVQVLHRQADIADRMQLAAALESVRATMPCIKGVFHLAGVLDDAPIASQTWERFIGVIAPKVRGTCNLEELTAEHELRHFVLYSSTAAVLGWRGQSSYASGNAFMDALARHRASRGVPGLSINWGPWREVGMAAATAASRGVDYSRWGLESFSIAEGVAALTGAMQSESSQTIAARVDLAKLPDGSLTRAAVRPHPRALEPRKNVLGEIRDAPPSQRMALLRQHVEREAAHALGLKPGFRFAGARALNELGLDSLLAVQLANALGASLSCPMTATLLFDYPTIDALVARLAEVVLNEQEATMAPGPASPPDLADLSDADAESLLMQELAVLRQMDTTK